jgi:hypothetical protein
MSAVEDINFWLAVEDCLRELITPSDPAYATQRVERELAAARRRTRRSPSIVYHNEPLTLAVIYARPDCDTLEQCRIENAILAEHQEHYLRILARHDRYSFPAAEPSAASHAA